MNESHKLPTECEPPNPKTQQRKRYAEIIACATYIALLVTCFGQFAERPVLTTGLALAALVVFICGRPYLRAIAVAAFLIPVATLINELWHQWPHLRPQPPEVQKSLEQIDREIDATTPTPK